MDVLNNSVFLHACLVTGRVFIGFYFFFFTFWNFYHRVAAIGVIRERQLPLPSVIFAFGLCLQFITGLLIIFAIYTAVSAALLVIFSLFATFMFHRFWTMEEGLVRTLNTIIFIGNLTITLGALLLVIGLSAG